MQAEVGGQLGFPRVLGGLVASFFSSLSLPFSLLSLSSSPSSPCHGETALGQADGSAANCCIGGG